MEKVIGTFGGGGIILVDFNKPFLLCLYALLVSSYSFTTFFLNFGTRDITYYIYIVDILFANMFRSHTSTSHIINIYRQVPGGGRGKQHSLRWTFLRLFLWCISVVVVVGGGGCSISIPVAMVTTTIGCCCVRVLAIPCITIIIIIIIIITTTNTTTLRYHIVIAYPMIGTVTLYPT